jgi:hypothetical protein
VRPDHAELRYIGHHHSQFNCTYHSQTQNPELRTSLPIPLTSRPLPPVAKALMNNEGYAVFSLFP